ncbi:uncharacterized protein LOC110457659 [Mizuhopecten yessoensis]|uniref:UPF0444 transmembrane protein C12orf23-like n=1 Tax=Mizuhopecten yessoensis TaxID=6573 RepID=A0A210Q892_MIZYE|nr:uncharacterized protein LOC110457659 [Mizuhopecten yessoensis]OWF44960.1 UPF0444 transmembrane protein C12orf23-like [Mizuhopecten yessoensis]
MASILQTVKSCVWKKPVSEQVEIVTDVNDMKDDGDQSKQEVVHNDVKENESPNYDVDKKTDEMSDPKAQGNLIWRMSSGIYSTATGAVGMGIGGAKWVANKSYDVGSSAAGYVKVPKLATFKKKDKKE